MIDWVPKQEGWITAGYTAYRKTHKKKHSKELFEKHIRKCFKDRGIDVDQIWSAPKMFMELFWQAEILKDWCYEITRLFAVRDAQAIKTRRKKIEAIEEFNELVQKTLKIYKED